MAGSGRHSHEDGHDHDHDEAHEHHAGDAHDHIPERRDNVLRRLAHAVGHVFGHSHGGHSHSLPSATDTSSVALRASKIGLIGLLVTAALQLAVVAISGSVALVSDTAHNFADASGSGLLLLAFLLSARQASRRYTYGLGRAEDVAGAAIVLTILGSAGYIAYESVSRLLHPVELRNLPFVAVAGVIGFLGNELVAVYKVRTGRQIGSAALIADGMHARVDGLTSLAVVGGVIGVVLGFPQADPIVGLVILAPVLIIGWSSGKDIWRRLMDGVEPDIIDGIAASSRAVPGVQDLRDVRARWMGHRLWVEMNVTIDEDLTTRQAHEIAEAVRHSVFHAYPNVAAITVHVDPCGHSGKPTHRETEHHYSGIVARVSAS